MMIPRLTTLALLGMLVGAAPAGAACERFGTQLDCAIGGRQVVIGTQAANEPTHGTPSFRPQGFHGNGRLLAGRLATTPLRIELQDVGVDASLCRRIGNEGYCY